jgi:steroid-24-oyl-CoA synthetase
VKAVVAVRPGSALNADALRAFCAETLASYKVPTQFDIRTSPLPRNATGKIMKHAFFDQAPAIFVEE